MNNYKLLFDNCPVGYVPMTKGDSVVYAKERSQISNYQTQGYKLAEKPASAPAEVENLGDNPLVSSDMSGKEAVAMIKENDVQFLDGFIAASEKRRVVLAAVKAKREEPIKAI